jgi:hypothetical protein
METKYGERFVKNITFSVQEDLLERAQFVARSRGKTLNLAFSEWLEQCVAKTNGGAAFDSMMHQLRHVYSTRAYTRNEMNER